MLLFSKVMGRFLVKKLILFVSILFCLHSIVFTQEIKYYSTLKGKLINNLFCNKKGEFYIHTFNDDFYTYIYKSTDFGINWSEVYIHKIDHDVLCFVKKDSLLFLGLSDSGRFKTSFDDGKTWKENRLPVTQPIVDGMYGIFDCQMVNSNIGAAISYVDLFFTEDGWKSFKKVIIPDSMTYFGEHSITFNRVIMPDANTICISGYDFKKGRYKYIDSAYFISSTDRGKTWKMNTITNRDLTLLDISSFSKDCIFAQGRSEPSYTKDTKGILYKTTNLGDTWEKLIDTAFFFGFFPDLRNISFYDKDHFAMSTGQYLFKTEDGAKTWKFYKVVDDNNLIVSLSYYEKDSIIIATRYQDLYKYYPYNTEVKENLTTINNISYYPNPTKETLNLKLSSEPEISEELTITDILGNNVLKIPIKDIQNQIDISQLVSGLYLCKLRQSGTVFKIEVVR